LFNSSINYLPRILDLLSLNTEKIPIYLYSKYLSFSVPITAAVNCDNLIPNLTDGFCEHNSGNHLEKRANTRFAD